MNGMMTGVLLEWHEDWERPYDTSASSFSLGGLDVSATISPKRFEWAKMNLDTGAAVNEDLSEVGKRGWQSSALVSPTKTVNREVAPIGDDIEPVGESRADVEMGNEEDEEPLEA